MDKKERKKINKRMDKVKKCSRCGNDFLHGKFCYNLPHENRYVCLCHICYNGLMFGHYLEFEEKIQEVR